MKQIRTAVFETNSGSSHSIAISAGEYVPDLLPVGAGAMTKETLAARLTGREYTNEITEAEEKLAKSAGLVVIFGASDNLCELRGAIDDEVGVYAGGVLLFTADGLLPELDRDDMEVLEKHGAAGAVKALRHAAIKIDATWGGEPGYSWTYKTDTPHATFEVMEDGEHYCRGIVIDLKELGDGARS
jgi:hypothetical protein